MKSERQEQIIEEAIKIIDSKGIQGLTIKNMSKAIGISEPAIYRHFESKNQIIIAILEILQETAIRFSHMMETKTGTAMDKISFMLKSIVSIFIDKPSLISVLFAEEIFKNEPVLEEKTVWVLNKNEETIENILQKGKDEGNIPSDLDTSILALLIMGSFRLLVKRWQMGNYNFDLERETDNLLTTLKKLIV
jgi:AcrR family transcriptional regulator